MVIVGRYHRVRGWGAQGWTLPYVLCRPRSAGPAVLVPYRTDEWVEAEDLRADGQRRARQLLRSIRGGAAGFGLSGWYQPGFYLGGLGSAAQTTVALDSNYVYDTGGDAIGVKFQHRLPAAKTLTGSYVYIVSYGGSPGGNPQNVNDLNFEFRNHSTNRPGSTLHASGSIDPASGTGWKALTGLSFEASANTEYWASWGDADGAAEDFVNVLQQTNAGGTAFDQALYGTSFSTNSGWLGTFIGSRPSSLILVWADGTVMGMPFTSQAQSANTTNRRGFRFADGLAETLKVWGLITGSSNNQNGIEAWEGASGPSGTPAVSGAITVTGAGASGAVYGMLFSAPYAIPKETPLRLVMTYGSTSNVPSRHQIGTGADATLKAAMLGGGQIYWAEANGTTDWSNDNDAEFPSAALVFADQVEVVGGARRTVGLPGRGGVGVW